MKIVVEITLSLATVALWGTLVLNLPGASGAGACEAADSPSTAVAIGLTAPAVLPRAAACVAPTDSSSR